MADGIESRTASVSVENEGPDDLFAAMKAFLAAHPVWSEPRRMQAALSGVIDGIDRRQLNPGRHPCGGPWHRLRMVALASGAASERMSLFPSSPARRLIWQGRKGWLAFRVAIPFP